MENRKIKLWEREAPYTEFSHGQEQPSVKEFAVKGSKGAVVVCPGGAYMGKAEHEGAPIAEMLNEAGISAYVLDYRVKPCHYNAPLADANRAIKVVRALGYEKVAILGFSAGGHLTCTAAVRYDLGIADSADPIERFSSRPDAFLPCYPVVSFVQSQHFGSIEALLSDKCQDDLLRRYFSAELNVTPETPPAFIWHTAEDNCVPVENSLELAKALSKNKVMFELHIYPHGWHGTGLSADWPEAREWPAECQRFLCNLGFGK